ncbi:MAG: DUF1847 domain-containing protein [Alphaproteobacteria bacterium]|nr:DUF1847 domain-containing protein [Rhodospirillales bacterium]MCW9045995.1 DUF1847 domain-containing protein [Alphaproteobacteria bacterium]
MSKYDDPSCAYCPTTIRACKDGDEDVRGPGWCPAKVDPEGLEIGEGKVQDGYALEVLRAAGQVESEGYCKWTRIEEICAFAKKMNYTKLGIATCIGFLDQANSLGQIFESHGFEVASACCKNGSIPKEETGLKDEEKIRPGQFEASCNPITQAEVLNRAGCEFNVVLALCVGHDSLFYKHSEALVTTLVTKDRVLAHNPASALFMADSPYFNKLWGPERPEKPKKKPAVSQKK